jgi:DNA-binding PadR family transcriptional regulator
MSRQLTEPVFLILLSLSETPQHGYGMMKQVEVLTRGRVLLGTGTIYGALRRLLKSKWIRRFNKGDASRRKHSYQLTEMGRKQLRAELRRMKDLLETAEG